MTAGFIPRHGGYRNLLSYRKSRVIYRGTRVFCRRFLTRGDRTIDQMIQAARSGKQNIIEGSMASGTSKKTEVFLTGVARASLEELLEDYQDYLDDRDEPIWSPDGAEVRWIRNLGDRSNDYETFRSWFDDRPGQVVANIQITLIHQATYLLRRQIKSLENRFIEEGGLSERMYAARRKHRDQKPR